MNDHLSSHRRASLLKLAGLLHDVGKPLSRDVDPESGRIAFYRHDKVGAEVMDGVAERLRMSGWELGF